MNPEELKTRIFLGSKIINKKTGVVTVVDDLMLTMNAKTHRIYLTYITDAGEIVGREIYEWERVK